MRPDGSIHGEFKSVLDSFLNIWPLTTQEVCPKALKFSKINFY